MALGHDRQRLNDAPDSSSTLDVESAKPSSSGATSSSGSHIVKKKAANPNTAAAALKAEELHHASSEAQWANRYLLARAVLAEFLVTSLFIFAVTCNVMVMQKTGLKTPASGPLCAAFAGIALIYSFADVSGAHFNPCVTFATMMTRKTSITKGCLYIVAQLFGSMGAMLLLVSVFPDASEPEKISALLVQPGEGVNLFQAFLMECALSYIFLYVIFATAFETVPDQLDAVKKVGNQVKKFKSKNLTIYSTSGQSKAGFAPIAIGFCIGFLCFLGGPISGGAFNPARVFCASVVNSDFKDHWLYWFGDCIGATAGAWTQILVSKLKDREHKAGSKF
eukprot:TRINITY_DN470_c0_g1::TRINITY_DN470_c0_g1_i1::g.2447::m.2447 TRINITY_DN470_c0_g1::TRINITY_DN470_c0_g1_i1::g.2447  ORF type:complete len:336 (+),score=110.95,sp/Q54WT8/AQPB_DICDI/51.14/4e-77,MIP/PF00230.15/9.4e-26,MIP/PF00230.15/1.9e-16 TRINITY_DN470_c0_g1_i1:51-1058(+)